MNGICLRSSLAGIAALIFCIGGGTAANAACAVGAKMASNFVVLDIHTIVLRNGSSSWGIVIKTLGFIYSSSNVTILKDSFCDFDDAVLYVDGEVVGVTNVTLLQ